MLTDFGSHLSPVPLLVPLKALDLHFKFSDLTISAVLIYLSHFCSHKSGLVVRFSRIDAITWEIYKLTEGALSLYEWQAILLLFEQYEAKLLDCRLGANSEGNSFWYNSVNGTYH